MGSALLSMPWAFEKAGFAQVNMGGMVRWLKKLLKETMTSSKLFSFSLLSPLNIDHVLFCRSGSFF